MAKVKRVIVTWDPAPENEKVVSYNVYWSSGDTFTYDTPHVNVTTNQIVLPDAISGLRNVEGKIFLAITAIDENGNESDMAKKELDVDFFCPNTPTNIQASEL